MSTSSYSSRSSISSVNRGSSAPPTRSSSVSTQGPVPPLWPLFTDRTVYYTSAEGVQSRVDAESRSKMLDFAYAIAINLRSERERQAITHFTRLGIECKSLIYRADSDPSVLKNAAEDFSNLLYDARTLSKQENKDKEAKTRKVRDIITTTSILVICGDTSVSAFFLSYFLMRKHGRSLDSVLYSILSVWGDARPSWVLLQLLRSLEARTSDWKGKAGSEPTTTLLELPQDEQARSSLFSRSWLNWKRASESSRGYQPKASKFHLRICLGNFEMAIDKSYLDKNHIIGVVGIGIDFKIAMNYPGIHYESIKFDCGNDSENIMGAVDSAEKYLNRICSTYMKRYPAKTYNQSILICDTEPANGAVAACVYAGVLMSRTRMGGEYFLTLQGALKESYRLKEEVEPLPGFVGQLRLFERAIKPLGWTKSSPFGERLA